MGQSEAGTSPESEPVTLQVTCCHEENAFSGHCETSRRVVDSSSLQVWHPPGPAVLVPPAGRVYKGARVVLQCEVEDWGRGGTAGHRVEWSRDGELVQGVTTANWTLTGIPAVRLENGSKWQVARIF